MNALALPDWLGKPLAVLLVDLCLAGDNALAIALVCASLPPRARRAVLLAGTAGAVALRFVLVGVAGVVLAVPGLKLAGGVVLALIALNLVPHDPRAEKLAPALDASGGVLAAALLVTLIDVLMSLDNVFALAAVAGGSLGYLALGLLLSVSALMFGSNAVAGLAGRMPGLARFGAVLLGWVAGRMAVTDPLFANAIAAQAPALPLAVPALAAAYVWLVGGKPPAMAPRQMAAAAAAGRDARPPARARVPPPPAPAPPAPPAPPEAVADEAAPDRAEGMLLAMFVGLFAVVGLALGALAVYAGGLTR